ncbi:MAG: aminotransferase class I/II-fold pyridoxal phosphate-dependent enzyme [Spirochaetaceae bacterium]|jgi:aminotransferase|nr:aminotransferase class I/II-fold pyridoxal phosphate-dependent enzyme [Spirochaetaceae bacterium]
MNYQQSKKAQFLLQSEIRNMSIECDDVNGINLAQGICDLPLEKVLSDKAREAMEAGENHYTRYDGIDILREEIAKKARDFNRINAAPHNIVVSGGATGALYSACFALFNPGDEIILFEPYYGYHEYTLMSLDLVPVYAALTPPDWKFNIDELQNLVTKKTKAILICTPSNPTGKIFSAEELDMLGDFCVKNNLIALTDEIYEYITFDGLQHISPASREKFNGRVVTVSGYSKTFSITGWRLGYCIADDEIVKWIGNASDLIYVCAPAPLQYGVACAIRDIPQSFYTSLKEQYQRKRDILCSTLSGLGLTPYIPKGAYYILADISSVPGKNGKDRAMYILAKTGVGVVPGEAFLRSGGGGIARFCFAKDYSVIEQACERLLKLK